MITDKHILHTEDEHESVKDYLINRYEKLKKGKDAARIEKTTTASQLQQDSMFLLQRLDSSSR
ncbi:MAG: hypothetical protein OHK0038_01590 [Flammeovirgaceae bacterium]